MILGLDNVNNNAKYMCLENTMNMILTGIVSIFEFLIVFNFHAGTQVVGFVAACTGLIVLVLQIYNIRLRNKYVKRKTEKLDEEI